MNLQELIRRQRELTEAARNEGRELTAAEQTEFDDLQRQIDAYGNEGPTLSDARRNEGLKNPENTDPENTRAAGIAAERQRMADITELCRGFEIDPQQFIRSGQTVDEVRAEVLEQLRKNNSPVNVRVTEDAEDKRRAAIADGILMRENIAVEKPEAGAENFRGASLWQIAANCLASDEGGKRNFAMMGPSELFDEVMSRSYYNPTASFPAIMDNVVNKAYKEGHKLAPVTFDRFTTKGTLRDFKKADNYYLRGSFGEFLEVPEGGELKHTTTTDEKFPQRQLKTYGRQFTMSRQAFINDDMGVVASMPYQAAKAARTTINTQVYRILMSDEPIYDGKPLFGKDHKNLLKDGSEINQAAVQTMILALGGHKRKEDGMDKAILIRPAILVVPLGYKFKMYTLFNSQTISASGDVNPLYQYRDSIEVVEDATLNALAGDGNIPWFMVGDRNDTDFIQVDYLNGQEIPNIRRMEKAGQLGFTWDVYGDWGITVLDYMGAVKNPGVKITSPLALA